MMEREDEHKQEISEQKGAANGMEKRLKRKIDELEGAIKQIMDQTRKREDQIKLIKGCAGMHGRNMAICDTDENHGKLKIRSGEEVIAVDRQEVEVLRGNDPRVAKSIDRLLTTNGERKREIEHYSGGETCQEKCKKAEDESKKAWDALARAKRDHEDKMEEQKDKERTIKEELKKVKDK